jgi:hypothetical protein
MNVIATAKIIAVRIRFLDRPPVALLPVTLIAMDPPFAASLTQLGRLIKKIPASP